MILINFNVAKFGKYNALKLAETRSTMILKLRISLRSLRQKKSLRGDMPT
jgi:hypothetical protein